MLTDDATVLLVRLAGIAHLGKVERHVVADLVDLLVVRMILDDLTVELQHLVARCTARLLVFCFRRQGSLFRRSIATLFRLVGRIQIVVGTQVKILRLLP